MNLLLFMTAALALNLAPGPDMLLVVSRSTASGARAGMAAALGIALGCLVHTVLVAAGLAAVLAAVPIAYDIVRFAGATYLLVIGARMLLRPGVPPEAASLLARRSRARLDRDVAAAFRQGVITNVLNPKVALFFLAFLPQFVVPRSGSTAMQVLALGLLFNLSGTAVNLIVAVAASRATAWLRDSSTPASWLHRVTGAVFVGLGVKLALAGRAR